jgi:NADPH:quinone reductase
LLTGKGMQHHGEILREATRLAESRMIRPIVDSRRFDLASVGDAYALVESKEAQGKVVIDVAQ